MHKKRRLKSDENVCTFKIKNAAFIFIKMFLITNFSLIRLNSIEVLKQNSLSFLEINLWYIKYMKIYIKCQLNPQDLQ